MAAPRKTRDSSTMHICTAAAIVLSLTIFGVLYLIGEQTRAPSLLDADEKQEPFMRRASESVDDSGAGDQISESVSRVAASGFRIAARKDEFPKFYVPDATPTPRPEEEVTLPRPAFITIYPDKREEDEWEEIPLDGAATDVTATPAPTHPTEINGVPHISQCTTCDRCVDGHHGFDPQQHYPIHVTLDDQDCFDGCGEAGPPEAHPASAQASTPAKATGSTGGKPGKGWRAKGRDKSFFTSRLRKRGTGRRLLGRKHPAKKQDIQIPYTIAPSTYKRTLHIGTDWDATPTRHCEECSGCTTRLIKMVKTKTWEGSNFTLEVGASSASLFRAYTDNTPSKMAIVKLFCLPKKTERGEDVRIHCDLQWQRKFARTLDKMVAMQRLADWCGIAPISTRAWIEEVRAVVPGSGVKVEAHGIFSSIAPGISLSQYSEGGRPRPAAAARLGVMRTLNHTEIAEAALFDMLTSQCDRHPQNIFMDPRGHIQLIDNDQGFADGWRIGEVDSIFLPRTDKHEIARIGNAAAHDPTKPHKLPTVQVLLDYRCHVKDGKIGKHFPPKMAQCMEEIKNSNAKDIRERLGIADHGDPVSNKRHLHWANSIITRAADMLAVGFEGALDLASEKQKKISFPLSPPCCALKPMPANQYTCTSEEPMRGAFDMRAAFGGSD